jgi:trigger factor
LSTEEVCKRTLDISIPVSEVEAETERVVASLQKKLRLPGFRPGHVPTGIIRNRFKEDIRQDVLENLAPKFFRERADAEGLNLVGPPSLHDVKYEPGQPLEFKVDFEVLAPFELKEYEGLNVVYRDPEVTDEELGQRLDHIRDEKAEYVNVDPRPLEAGDFAVVSLESLSGVEGEPIKNDEMMLHIGAEDTLPAFTENLTGAAPGEEREFEVSYSEEYSERKLAGKTVRFRAAVKGVRRKELPELNDEFARDLGDYKDLSELREAVRKVMLHEKEYVAQQDAKNKLVETLVDTHDFPVPEALIDRRVEDIVEQNLRSLAMRGVDPRTVKLDWEKIRESQRDKAVRDVKASLLLDRVADKQQIEPTNDEVDRELQRLARQERQPVAALRVKFEKDGTLRRIASHIRTEKTLNYLFERARKVAE